MKNDNQKHEMFYKTLLLFFGVTSSLIILELSLWFINYTYFPLRIEIDNDISRNDWRYYHTFDEKYFVYNPEFLWRPRPNFGVFNEQGFRGELFDVQFNDEYVIVAIGDSNTLGSRVYEDTSWPHYLEQKLREKYENITVVNAGVWGYSSFQGLSRLKEILKYHPDMVIISFGANDAHMVQIADKYWAEQRNPIQNLRLYLLIKSITDKIRILVYNDIELVHRVSMEDYEENFLDMINIAESNDIRIILLTRPYIYYPGEKKNPLWWKTYAESYNNMTVKIANWSGVPVIDIYEMFETRDDLFIDESHFTDEGNRIMGTILYQELEYLTELDINEKDESFQ